MHLTQSPQHYTIFFRFTFNYLCFGWQCCKRDKLQGVLPESASGMIEPVRDYNKIRIIRRITKEV